MNPRSKALARAPWRGRVRYVDHQHQVRGAPGASSRAAQMPERLGRAGLSPSDLALSLA